MTEKHHTGTAAPSHAPDLIGGLLELAEIAAATAAELRDDLRDAAVLVLEALLRGRKVLACGNGGSAADAQHFVAELVGHMAKERRSLPAISLSADPSTLTAISNDYGYEKLFARQIEGLGSEGDVLFAITTSGRSPNVLLAVEAASVKGMKTIALTGKTPADRLTRCDICLRVNSQNPQRVQEIHTALLHAICDYIDQNV